MELLHIICPNSTSVWDGNGFSKCFSDMVIGFGANWVTILMIFVLGITRKSVRGVYQQANLSEKVVLHFLPALGAVIEFIDMVFLLKKALQGKTVTPQEWFFRWSQFLVWNSFLLFPKLDGQHMIFRNRILCFWWIVKLLLGIPHLESFIFSSEMLLCFKEGCIVLLDITFGISINIIRYKRVSSRVSLMEEPLLDGDVDLEEGDIKNSGAADSFWHLLTFKSINPVMSQGVIKQLDFEDLLQLPTDMDLSSYHQTMLSCWQAEQRNNSTSLSLLRAICYAYGWSYFRLGLLKILNDSLGFAGPLLLNKLIRFLQRGSGHLDGLVLALSLGLASILKSFLDTQYSFHLSKLKLKLRSSIMIMIYQKCLSVSLAQRLKFSEGEIQTYMSIDADRTVNICNSFHDLWSLPLQIGVALYLLYTQVKFAFVAGVAIIILLIPVNKWIANFIAIATEKMMKQKDERIRRTGELLTYIRTIKIYGWELLFTGWLMKTRSLEVTHLSTRKYLDAWCVFFWATTPTLFSLFTFGLYTLMGNQLDAAVVFTCLALFNTLISPLNSFPWVINGLIDSFISTRRLSRFLSNYEHKTKLEQEADYSPSFSNGHCNDTHEDMAVVIHDACCAWSISDQKEQTMVLNNVTLGISKGSLVAVIGEVGSGKSSLLNSILGETRLTHGSICTSGNLAYVPQVPWILSGTIRENILFEKDYDQDRYGDVLQACALDVDISLMLGGDMAYIGEKGTNLSGGQRARLALARAIYFGADVFLFDDVLSAVDAQVAQWILYSAILGPLTANKTRILCTHNVQAISSANMIILMDKGHVKWVGSSAEFSSSSHSLTGPLKVTNTTQVQKHKCTINTSIEVDQILASDKYILPNFKEGLEIVEVEMRRKGKVEIAVYKSYASFAGWFITIIICLSAILMQASRNGNDLWLSYWVDTTTDKSRTERSTSSYLVILCIFAVVNSSLTLVRAFSFSYGGLHAAVQVHNTLINKLVNAPVNFFDRTPGGRILNRFSSDLYTIDDSLPFILNILLANLVGLLGIVVILSYVQVLFLLLLLPFWYIYSKLQLYYRSTSRELRRLDSVSRSPIYASFTETLDGSSTIRAFKSENFFLAKFTNHLAMYQRTSYSDIIASLWLSLRLQLMGAFVISFVAVMAVVGSRGNLPLSFGTPGLVGLALSYAAPIVSLLGSFLTSFAETEKEMVSVERILQYMDVAQEDLHGSQPLYPDWPLQGLVEFQNVSLRYMPSLPAALNDVTFSIQRGVQVGVVGRTGAGKSSVLNALFRLAPICKGRILVDGINIADISVRDLRAHLAVVPQSPFLFEGTLRDNLDPFRKSEDLKLWNVLEKCHIKEEVQAAGGLETLVKESGTSFSVGQRQLLCLARALLKSSKILCLDECTASVDSRTASVLQNTISSECRGMTVITIAHRISTVLNMDNILILDQGILVEEGNPQVLLQHQFSRFSSFAKASTM